MQVSVCTPTGERVNLTVETLRSGTRIARPEGGLGTMGWSPAPWTIAYVTGRTSPLRAFLGSNPSWTA